MKTSISIFLTTALALCPLLAEENTRPGKGKADGSFFKSLDTNSDQAISKEEAGDKWEHMGKLDKDDDGKVTLQELAAARGGAAGKPGDKPGKGGPGKGGPGEMFKRADKNGDGKLSKDEVPEAIWDRLGKLDQDGDNAISHEEAKAARPDGPGAPGGGGKGKGGPGEMLKKADRNGDGNISKDEVPGQAWDRLGKLDTDNDGVVTKEEIGAGMAAMRGKGKDGMAGKGKGKSQQGGQGAMFLKLDKDKDGKLAESEVPAELWGKLRKADTDADGLVSKEELDKVYKAREAYSPASA
ncbi:MAG: hypothetical protein P1U68_00045 [Verrucomicrobiales bacterium]|nr:hypothetical protein [Verrucomicrobiales bacterium]